MRHGREEPSTISTTTDQTLDIISAVSELNGLSSQELNKLLKDSENYTIQYKTEEGSLRQIDLEKVASFLPLHLIAVLLSPERDVKMAHVLQGFRLLHTLSDLATRHGRLEQILLDDVKVSEQILDLIFFTLIVLARCNQENRHGALSLLHSGVVACSLHLLMSFISSQWHDLVHVLLAHSKVDIFMDVAFDAVCEDIRILDNKLKTLHRDIILNKASLSPAEKTVHFICQQCEASLHFLLSLCQQKLFRDRILRNKELCKEGGILILAYAILKLNIPQSFNESSDILASVSRLKAKVLSILLQLCEAESISYLDEVAGSSQSMHLAKSVALEFLALLKTAYKQEVKQPGGSHYRSNPMGLVVLNALHLADIFSDDSNFRSFFMTTTVPFLAEIFAVPHEEFTSNWCSLRVPLMEEDANIEYDAFIAAGMVLDSLNSVYESAQSAPFLLSEVNSACPLTVTGVSSGTYAQQRTSCLVKIIANLHVFVPNICEEEERDLFLDKFYEYLLMETSSLLQHPSPSHIQKTSTICKNLSSLSQYAASLAPSFLNDEDVHLLSVYADRLQMLTQRLCGEGTSQENCIKDKAEDTKSDTMYYAQDSPTNRVKVHNSTFAISRQDSQAIQKQDEMIEEVASEFNYNDADLKGLSRQGSRSQETDQTANLPDGIQSDLCRKGNINNPSASSKDQEKEIGSFETNGTVQPYRRMDLELLSDGRESFKQDHTRESGVQEDEKADNGQAEEKQPRKRKRNIMSEKQIVLIERALLDEPEMQKNGPLLQSWADKLSSQGPEITSSQLKNWLNNRKARLARAAKEVSYAEKSSAPSISTFYDSPESVCDENYVTPARGSGHQSISRTTSMITRAMSSDDSERSTPSSSVHATQLNRTKCISLEPDQFVSISDSEGKVVGEGKIYQVEGRWHGKNLDGRVFVVDITDLKIEKWKGVLYPSEAAGRTFEEAVAKNDGVMRVLWDTIRISPKS